MSDTAPARAHRTNPSLPALPAPRPEPTTSTYAVLTAAYDAFNRELFDDKLPNCLITLQRKSNARGYFWGETFESRRQDANGAHVDEIALNPETFKGRSDADILSTLAHEMCHLWQHHHGHPSANGHHNREWGVEMRRIGLEPSNTGAPGGKATGRKMTHYILEDGPYARAAARFLQNQATIDWQSRDRSAVRAARPKSKVKYSCPACGLNAWGKPGIAIRCTADDLDMLSADSEGDEA